MSVTPEAIASGPYPQGERTIMRTIQVLAITAVASLLLTGSASASDVEAELQAMQERIEQLEGERLSEANSFAAEQASGSGLSSMLENTEMAGWVAASYNYNFEGFKNSAGTTNNVPGPIPTSNSFSIDQAWLSISNPADENGRGGVQMELESGNSATGTGGTAGLNVFTANASYLAPIGNGMLLTGGLMGTLIGAEVNQQNGNFNVTRGLVWGLQPVNVLGATVGTNLTDEISIVIGVTNDHYANALADTNNEKVVTGQIAWANKDSRIGFSFNYGDDGGDTNMFIGDILLSYDGIEDFSTWVNYTVLSTDDDAGATVPGEGEIHGISVAGRLALADDMGIALRGEAVITDTDTVETEIYSLTITGDKSLTDHLTAKAEVRLDFDADDGLPNDKGFPTEDVAAIILAQLIYEF